MATGLCIPRALGLLELTNCEEFPKLPGVQTTKAEELRIKVAAVNLGDRGWAIGEGAGQSTI